MLTDDEIKKVAAVAWAELEGMPEVRYVHEAAADPYKPFYRMATILVNDNFPPAHFQALGLRRHLTEEEALAVVRETHPYLRRKLDEEGEAQHFLSLFTDFRDMYDPESW